MFSLRFTVYCLQFIASRARSPVYGLRFTVYGLRFLALRRCSGEQARSPVYGLRKLLIEMYILSDNIISPLGFTTSENYQVLRSGHSALRRYDSLWGLPDPVCASLFTESQKARLQTAGLTFFESLAVASISDALQRHPIDVSSHRVALVIASTKGNIQDLDTGGTRVNLADSAEMIARHIGITTTPIVVCNACISGTSAQALALRRIVSRY